MKKIYVISLFLISNILTMAQSFDVRIENTETIINEGDTVMRTGHNDESIISKHFVLDNTTDNDIDLKVTREDIVLPSGMKASFCFGGNCYPPTTMESQNETVAANSTSDFTLDADLDPQNETGEALIKMTVTKPGISSENTSFYVNFHVNPVGVSHANPNALKLYPNPVKNNLYIETTNDNYRQPLLKIYNAVGKVVKQVPLSNAGDLSKVNLAHLSKGVYMVVFYNASNSVCSQKLIKK